MCSPCGDHGVSNQCCLLYKLFGGDHSVVLYYMVCDEFGHETLKSWVRGLGCSASLTESTFQIRLPKLVFYCFKWLFISVRYNVLWPVLYVAGVLDPVIDLWNWIKWMNEFVITGPFLTLQELRSKVAMWVVNAFGRREVQLHALLTSAVNDSVNPQWHN